MIGQNDLINNNHELKSQYERLEASHRTYVQDFERAKEEIDNLRVVVEDQAHEMR